MQFDDREKVYENKFSMDQETLFRVEARASKLIGLWAAEKMGMSGADAENYAKEVIAANLDEPGYDDVKRKLEHDFALKNVVLTSNEVNIVIEKSVAEATKQIVEGK